MHGHGVRSAWLPDERRGFFGRPSKCPPLCDDTLAMPGFVHASVVLPSTYGDLETSLIPCKFALEGGAVHRRLSSRGSCWSRLASGLSAVVIRGLAIKSRASFQDSRRGSQPLRPVSPRLQFMLGIGGRIRWGRKSHGLPRVRAKPRGLLAFSFISRNLEKL